MNLAPVTKLLRERIGLDPESLGPTALPRAVAAHMKSLALAESDVYAGRLAGDPQEFQVLVAELTVPETWFFRGGDVFAYLAGQIAEAIRRRPERRFRILSIPCCTGEEPYSLAIALMEAGVSPDGWTMEGVDLCTRHIARANQGRYGDFSFRQTSPPLRQRYFRPVDSGWELDPAIRALVRFRTGNLLDPLFLAGEEAFDLVFCRNLFIYLDLSGRRRALVTIDRLLAPQGLLCAGHAEPLEDIDPRFGRTGPDGLFLYSRLLDGPDSRTALLSRPSRADGSGELSHRKVVAFPATVSRPVPVAPSQGLPTNLLLLARQQADAGQLDDALANCEAHLAGSGPSADLFSLMGVIFQARRQNDEAARSFRRALYLEPEHREALTHLMLVCQSQGDQVQSAQLRSRLERTTPGGDA